MPINFRCPHCGAEMVAEDRYAGTSGPCQRCGQTVTVPTVYTPQGAPAPSRKMSTGVLVIIIVAALLLILMCAGVPIALLLPAVQAAREAARRTQCTNNLKQIALAVQIYHDMYGCYPPNDYQSPTAVSWRTMLLPFLEQGALYERYDKDQAWDSPANRLVADTQIPVFCCPSCEASSPAVTHYVKVVGPGTMGEPGVTLSWARILDGSSNTIYCVEYPWSDISWAEPRDITFEELLEALDRVSKGKGGHPGGINVVFCDGSVRFISSTIDRQVLWALLTRNGGETVSEP